MVDSEWIANNLVLTPDNADEWDDILANEPDMAIAVLGNLSRDVEFQLSDHPDDPEWRRKAKVFHRLVLTRLTLAKAQRAANHRREHEWLQRILAAWRAEEDVYAAIASVAEEM